MTTSWHNSYSGVLSALFRKDSTGGPQSLRNRRWLLAVALCLVAGAALLAWHFIRVLSVLPDGLLQANGRIEGDHIAIASKAAGRISELKVREGDQVSAGEVLARLDDGQVMARLNQAQAAVNALIARQEAARLQLQVLKEQVPLQITSANAAVGQARAAHDKAEAARAQAVRDAQRMHDLAERGTIAQQRAELAALAATAAEADTAASRAAVTRANQSATEARLGNDQVRAKQAEVESVAAELSRARATLQEVQSVFDDLTLRAPRAGMIVTRVRDVGEVVAAGAPLFDLVDLDRLYLKVYIAEKDIGAVRRGLPGRIYTDAFPERFFGATVRYISSQAEFTPKEVQTTDERVKLTYAVHLYLDENPQHRLTPGLPADAVIREKEGVAWQRPKW